MAHQIFNLPPQQPLSAAGRVLPGSKLYFYESGTSTPAAVYTTSALNVAHSQPLIADAGGRFDTVYLDPSIEYKATITSSTDVLLYTIDPVNDQLLSQGIIGEYLYPQTDSEVSAGVTPVNYAYPPGDVRRYNASHAIDATNDWSGAFQSAVNQAAQGGASVYVPASIGGFYRCDSTIDITAHAVIYGDGFDSIIRFYGCDGFTIAQDVNVVAFIGLRILAFSALGVASPKTHTGISYDGASGHLTAFHTLRDLLMDGWSVGINFSYTWSTTIDHVVMNIDNDTSIRLFGQSVNNCIVSSFISGTTNAISTVKDGSTQGEGLMISECLIAQAANGVNSDGFLSLNIINSVIDLITDKAVTLLGSSSTCISNCWIYAANVGVDFQALSVISDQASSISACRIQATAANGKAVSIGNNNVGISIVGATLVDGASGTARCVFVDSTGTGDVTVSGCHLLSTSGNASVYAGVAGVLMTGCTGDATIEYNTFPSIASAAAITIPKAQGDVFRVTGTTNITSATATGMAGRKLTLIFADALTFTDGSNLKLSANLVTTGDDTITLVCDGTNWYEVCRSVN